MPRAAGAPNIVLNVETALERAHAVGAMPEKIRCLIESAHTWPVRSISSALLMAVTLGLRPMRCVSLVRSHGWNSSRMFSLHVIEEHG